MENLIFEPMKFVNNLKWMGIGLIGIFMIIGIIIAATYIISYATSNTGDGKKNDDQ